MKVKWGGIFWISELEESEKYKENEGNKGINRIGFYCHVTYLDIAYVKNYCTTSHSKSTISHEEVETWFWRQLKEEEIKDWDKGIHEDQSRTLFIIQLSVI